MDARLKRDRDGNELELSSSQNFDGFVEDLSQTQVCMEGPPLMSSSSLKIVATAPVAANGDEVRSKKKILSQKIQIQNENEEKEKDVNMSCVICLERLFFTGDHQICSLVCGHCCFGYNCIDKWIKSHKSCPMCHQEAKAKDLRRLFIPNTIAIADNDTSIKLKRELEKERAMRIAADNELGKVKAKVFALETRIKILQTQGNKI